jgi:hypothetical protein
MEWRVNTAIMPLPLLDINQELVKIQRTHEYLATTAAVLAILALFVAHTRNSL